MNNRAKIAGWAATGLTLVWFLVHTFVGGPEVAGPLLAADLPLSVKAPALMVWHMVTVLLLLVTAFFAIATRRRDRSLMAAATVVSVGLAGAGLVSAPLTGAGFALLPQGFLFVLTGAIGTYAWAAMR